MRQEGNAQFPRVRLSWHEGRGLVVHCLEDELSWRFFLAESAALSEPEVDIVLGFDMTPQFWMNLQAAYDLDLATRASADRIKRDVHPREAA